MKLAVADQDAEKTIHMLKSTNMHFYKAIWEAAKGSQALVTFHKRFYCGEKPTRHTKRSVRKRAIVVDIVAKDGTEWIKVSTVTEERLLREIEKARWELAESSDEEDDAGNIDRISEKTNAVTLDDSATSDDEYDRMDLARAATDLVQTSQSNRLHYENPRIRIVLPKIPDPPREELFPLLDRIRSKGILLDLSAQPAAELENLEVVVFPRLLPSPHPQMTPTVNIDCTILLALVSDLSYAEDHPIHPSFNDAIRRQIELERQDHLLPLSLWPALVGKKLVCTKEAEVRMREIVDTIGTPTERSRTDLIMESRDVSEDLYRHDLVDNRESTDLRKQLQEYSDFPVPEDFQIPILVKQAPNDNDINAEIQSGKLPATADRIARDLTPINKSVFMFGWVNGFTTASSNRTVMKAMERMIEKNEPGKKGPEVWLREPARSLVGKENERWK